MTISTSLSMGLQGIQAGMQRVNLAGGRIAASAVMARLHAEPAFQADLKKAKAEVAKARRKLPAPDCARESAALAAQ